MTREQKIQALIGEYRFDNSRPLQIMIADAIENGILAGIRLRDEELLAMEFDAKKAIKEFNTYEKNLFCVDSWIRAARWQHEQFMKAIKGDGDETKL